MEDYLKYTYKLETHLKVICDSNEEYANLYATWKLNQKIYSSVLKTVVMNYPHYSLHDDSHSESIITNIEMLLGEERIKRLSPTETWMILQCAYLHDFGMALLSEKAELEWETDEFKEYLEEKRHSFNNDIAEAIEYIDKLNINLQDDKFEKNWPLKIRKYVTYIIADYFRSKHSSLTKEYLDQLEKWEIDISHNNLIHERLIKLIGEISFLHTQDFDKVMKLNYESNGYKSDYIHPRFIAEMIRLGDLLDLDNGRFSSYVEKVIGGLPKLSKDHKEKHQSTRHVLITPKNIEVSADCPNEEVYRETRSWFLWLEEEIKNLTMNWIDIIPSNLTGYAPKLTQKELLLKGEPDLNNITDLRFEISQEKAFDIIEGSNIYEDKYIFVREFIQNSLDASKIQLWRDLNDGMYNSWIKTKKELKNLMPFDILKEIYNNYIIEVTIEDIDSNYVGVSIRDRGIGISIDALKAMCDVGSSYSGKLELKKEINKMPAWLRPTAGFGIGLQSGFLVADEFKAHSRTGGNSAIEITFESRKRSDGYIQVRKSEKNIKRGTEFYFKLKKDANYSLNYGGHAEKHFENLFDPISSDNLLIYKILDSAKRNCEGSVIPIYINIDNKDNETFNSDIVTLFDAGMIEEGNYAYNIANSLDEMKLWVKDKDIYLNIRMQEYDSDRNILERSPKTIDFYFKGIKLDRQRESYALWEYICVDIYGMDTKESLKLSRDELTLEARKDVGKTIDEGVQFYIAKLKENIDILKEKAKEMPFDKIAFIVSGSMIINNFKASDYKILLDRGIMISVMKKNDNKFILEKVDFVDIIDEYPNLTYANINSFKIERVNNVEEEYDYAIMEGYLNKNISDIEEDIVIVDKNLIKILENDFRINKIQCIESELSRDLLLYSAGRENRDIINVNEKTEEYLIDLLVSNPQDSLNYSKGRWRSQRNCIPAFSGYNLLAIKTIPAGLAFYKSNKMKQLISPITRKDKEKIESVNNKELFIESITVRQDYKNLLFYTMNNRISEKIVTIEVIDKLYKEIIGKYFELMKKKIK